CSENACAEGTLECGSGSYRLCARDSTAAAWLPHSKALRASYGGPPAGAERSFAAYESRS
ncbi:MAG TPA: hypothetical protein VED66_07360, partial [Candidatus Sulfotelmatobacter sp.]|nr:hypothetical protein [Candidatus Sulfotelmatobacter sp.]